MSLPDPIPDDPRKWEGWRTYSSRNYYERLGYSFEENPTDAQIEEACRKLLVWWQKKLPLKNQPSNPLAQLLRDGLDEAPQFLVEARAFLVDPEKRKAFNEELLTRHKQSAGDEFRKYVKFAFHSGQLSSKDEANLLRVGLETGLTAEEITVIIETQMAEHGVTRVVEAPVPPPQPQQPNQGFAPPLPMPDPRMTPSMPYGYAPYQPGYITPVHFPPAAPAGDRTPEEEYRRVLKISRLNVDGMSDEQRIAFITLGMNMGMEEMEAEEILDDYLDQDASDEDGPDAVAGAPAQVAPQNYGQPQGYPPQGYPMPPPGYSPPGYPVPAGYEQGPHTPQFHHPQSPYFPYGVPMQPQPVPQAPVETPVPDADVVLSPTQERTKYADFTNGVGMEMRLVLTGKFTMGNDSPVSMPHEKPVREVKISRFFMSRFPVTNAQYEAFEASHKMKRPEWSKDNHPVVNVSSLDAIRYCEWLTNKEGGVHIYRLPTEAEWEYAARGGDNRMYPWGNTKSRGDVANFADVNTKFAWSDHMVNDGYAYTSPVGAFSRGASPFGIEDMAGNVWEWCQDYYGPYRLEDCLNPKGIPRSDKRVCRGGSWRSKMASLRTSFRHFNVLNYSFLDQGFRVVRECDPPARPKKK